MRGINSVAVYARKAKTTLTLKAGSEINLSLKKDKMFLKSNGFCFQTRQQILEEIRRNWKILEVKK